MKILGIERDQTACNHYRVLQPLAKLRMHGLADSMTIGDWELGTDFSFQKVMEADILLFQRPASEEWFKFIKKCQLAGKIIVVDYDDDPFNTHPLNPYYKFVGVKEYLYQWPDGNVDMIWQDGVEGFDIERNIMRRDMFNASFRQADMVTCTTDILKEKFLQINKNTVVLPNLLDFYFYKKPEFVKKEVRIGYQCGASHYEDLYIVRDAIEKVLENNENAKFVYFGDLRFKNLFQNIPTPRIEFHDWVKHVVYPYKLSLLNLDIGICPLVDNEFNRNKSSIKFFEYSAIGAATVASNIPPYSNTIKHLENGLLVGKQQEWIDALDLLVKNRSERESMAKKAFDYVYEEHNSDKKAHLWADAYNKILNMDITEELENVNDLFESTK